jgi:hypothetical protein
VTVKAQWKSSPAASLVHQYQISNSIDTSLAKDDQCYDYLRGCEGQRVTPPLHSALRGMPQHDCQGNPLSSRRAHNTSQRSLDVVFATLFSELPAFLQMVRVKSLRCLSYRREGTGSWRGIHLQACQGRCGLACTAPSPAIPIFMWIDRSLNASQLHVDSGLTKELTIGDAPY